jgi:hypothetical protein
MDLTGAHFEAHAPQDLGPILGDHRVQVVDFQQWFGHGSNQE